MTSKITNIAHVNVYYLLRNNLSITWIWEICDISKLKYLVGLNAMEYIGIVLLVGTHS